MSNSAGGAPGATAIRPFTVEIPEAEIEALRARLGAARWPSRELVDDRSQGVQPPPEVKLPVGFTTFPGEIFRAPRSWVEKSYPNLTYFHETGRGGHFAAWEEPELFATEIRAAFRPLR